MNQITFEKAQTIVEQLNCLMAMRQKLEEEGVAKYSYAGRRIPEDVREAGMKVMRDMMDAKIMAKKNELKEL